MDSRARYDLTALAVGAGMGLLALLSPHTRWMLMEGSPMEPIAAVLQAVLAACASAWCTARIFRAPIVRLTRWRGVLLAVALTAFGGVLLVPLWAVLGQFGLGTGASDFLDPQKLPALAVIASLYSLPFAPAGWLGTWALRAVSRA